MVRGRTVYHCHGRRKGKKIATFPTSAAARRFHGWIKYKKKSKGRS